MKDTQTANLVDQPPQAGNEAPEPATPPHLSTIGKLQNDMAACTNNFFLEDDADETIAHLGPLN